MDQTVPDGSVGHRVARQRVLAGLTRGQLANRAYLDVAGVSAVERGLAAASPAFTAAVARALGVEVDTLYGQPYGSAIIHPAADHAGVPALRVALDRYDDPDVPGRPMTAAQLRIRLDCADQDRGRAHYGQLTAALPELLQHAYLICAAARPGAEAETAGALLADACLLAQTVSYRFGHLDLAALCNAYARCAAEGCSDPLRAAVITCERSLVWLHRGHYDAVDRAIEHAYAQMVGLRSPASDAVRVQLHLRQAIACARRGAADQADEHLKVARELVTPACPAAPYYPVIASPTNVDIHWVAVAVELGDATTALHRAEQIELPPGTEPARAGRYWIDLARAWTLAGDHTKALDALLRARAIAPQLVRYHPQVHETVHLLAETDRRRTDSLAGIARWTGVTS